MTEILSSLIEKCNLGTIVSDPVPVSGGFMHRMFKVQTSTGTHAVKCLNPEIMKRPGVLDNYAEAERLERILEGDGLPVVAALTFDDRKMIEEDGRYFYVFNWIEGKITDFNSITADQCRKAGEILGRIHRIDPKIVEPEDSDVTEIDFRSYLSKAKESGSSIADILESNIGLLDTAVTELNDARRCLPSIRSIINDDMDPKNIMWNEGHPHVIDLECLEYGNPVSSALNLALQWSGTVTENFIPENLKAFFDGYLGAYDNGFKDYDKIFGIAYAWVEWLEYNIKRALGEEDESEIKLGETETINTIGRIKYLKDNHERINEVLRNIII